MLLAIDIGNTSIGLGVFDDDKLKLVAHLGTNINKTADEYAVSITEVLMLYKTETGCVSDVIVSSVVPPLNPVIKSAVELVFGCKALFVAPGIKSGISIRCDNPSSVGADLIAAAVGTHCIYGSPALIIDIGTATKMTVIDKNGTFIGTSIIPGVVMGLNALSEGTAQLPKISIEVPDRVIAKNTVECMRSGVVYGNASMIDGMIERIFKELGEDINVYATGGLASFIIPFCKHDIMVVDNLVLWGLNFIYKKSKNK